MSRIKFLNIELDNFTMGETIKEIDCLVQERKNAYAVTPNVDHVVQLQKDKKFLEIYRHADLVLTDGKPLLWIAKLYGISIKEKVSGSDLFPEICKLAAEKGYRMFFLGAAEGVAQRAAQKLQIKYKGLQIVGTYSPPYGFEKDNEEVDKIIQKIKGAKPHILIVGLGAPKQEKFIYQYKSQLEVPFSIGLGASLDFEAGNVKRAPKWLSKIGLEWLYRTIKEPRRLAGRYLYDAYSILPIILRYRRKQ